MLYLPQQRPLDSKEGLKSVKSPLSISLCFQHRRTDDKGRRTERLLHLLGGEYIAVAYVPAQPSGMRKADAGFSGM
jgi:hypothetical protein